MTWQKIEPDQQSSDMWNFQTNSQFEGEYIGVDTNVGASKSTIYRFKTDNGPIGIWSTYLLDTRLKNVQPGERVKIIYLGKVRSQNGGRSYHNFEVYHWIDQSMLSKNQTEDLVDEADKNIPF